MQILPAFYLFCPCIRDNEHRKVLSHNVGDLQGKYHLHNTDYLIPCDGSELYYKTGHVSEAVHGADAARSNSLADV